MEAGHRQGALTMEAGHRQGALTMEPGHRQGAQLWNQIRDGALIMEQGISLVITAMKSTHESIPFKHSVIKLYNYSSFMLNIV